MAHTGNAPQIYADVARGWTAAISSNKSAERNLVYLLPFLGSAIYLLYFLFVQNKNSIQNIPVKEVKKATLVVLLLVVFVGTYYFVYFATKCLLVALALYVYKRVTVKPSAYEIYSNIKFNILKVEVIRK